MQVYSSLGPQAVETAADIIDLNDWEATASAGPSTSISSYRQIGPYKLLQQIGEGMGSVWMAEQEDPIRRRVALKLVCADIGSKEAIARFEAERQALSFGG